MRATCSGGKPAPCCVETAASPGKRRHAAETGAAAYRDDGGRPRRATRAGEAGRRREADRLLSEAVALPAQAGTYPAPMESDGIHELLARVCMVVKAAWGEPGHLLGLSNVCRQPAGSSRYSYPSFSMILSSFASSA